MPMRMVSKSRSMRPVGGLVAPVVAADTGQDGAYDVVARTASRAAIVRASWDTRTQPVNK
jgi:hypothetical protein